MRRQFITLALLILAPQFAAAQQAETIEYYAHDAIGSIRVVFNPAGTVLARQDYAPFGRQLFTVPAMPKEGFGGQEKDDETDQAYFHARMFQARAGRFTRPDPIPGSLDNPQGFNRYAYALNNPETVGDPTGLFPVPLINPCLMGMCYTETVNVSGVGSTIPIGSDGVAMTDDLMRIIPQLGFDGGGTGSPGQSNPTTTPLPTPAPTPTPTPVPPPNPGPEEPPTRPHCQPGFLQAAKASWQRAGYGTKPEEAGFWVLERAGQTFYQPLPFTNERNKMTLTVPPGRTALFHTHPNGRDPRPVGDDKRTASQLQIPVFAGSRDGLWVISPGAREPEFLRSGVTWTTPCRK